MNTINSMSLLTSQGDLRGKPVCAVIGDFRSGNLENSITSGLLANDWEVIKIEWEIPKGFRASLAARLPISASIEARSAWSKMGNEFQLGMKIDLVLIVKGFLMQSREIGLLRQVFECPVICWNPDDPLDHAISNRGGNSLGVAKHFDAYVTWSAQISERLIPFVRNVCVVPFGWDPNIYFPEPSAQLELVDLVRLRPTFVGTWTKDREQMLTHIRDFRPIVFGNGWRKTRGLEIYPEAVGSDLRAIYSHSLVSINVLRPQNSSSHNMRTFEVPGCGGIIASQVSDEIADLYAEDTFSGTFKDLDDLGQLIDSTKPHDIPIPRPWIEGHKYQYRICALLDQLKELSLL